MENDIDKVRWAPRIPRHKIRQLYENDAQGIIDGELIDEVAYGCYARCRSILTVTEAEHGRVECPCCGQIIRRHGGKEETLTCPQCAWEATWGAYFKTYHRKQLSGGGAVAAFKEYVERLPAAQSPKEKMLLVDRLIHEVHKALATGQESPYWRPAAVNLIQGNMTRVMALLEDLAYGPGTTPEIRQAHDEWREKTLPRLWGRGVD